MEKPEADALFKHATGLQQAGKLDEARAIYEQILAAIPGYQHVPHLLGVIVAQEGNFFYARRLIESAIHMHGPDADALANLGWVLFHLGHYDLALARCELATQIEPGQLRAWITGGLSLRLLGRFPEALMYFNKALALQPGMAETLNYRGQVLHAMERYADALESYDAALQAAPQYPDVFNNRGSTLTLLERHEEAFQSFQQALALQPRFPEALMNLGLGLQNLERFEEALAHYDAAIELRPDYPEAHIYRAIALQRLRLRPQDCLASLDRALVIQPRNFDALNIRANIQAELELYTQALEDYDRALQLKSDFHETHVNRAHALRELGRRDEAVAEYREAIRLGGDPRSGMYALASMGLEPAPPVAPVDYIVNLFDKYAARFDKHLVGHLKYNAHELLCEAIMRMQPGAGKDVVDLGCGTGLCGPLLQPIARSMTGIDLSPRMLDQSAKRGVYTNLVRADIVEYLKATPPQSVDIVVSTDVFIYIGDLVQVFAGVKAVLRPQGLFGFSIEAGDSDDFVLRATRRYAHSTAYIERLAAANGFKVALMEPAVIRKEHETDMPGYIIVLQPA